MFEGKYIEEEDTRRDYQETRLVATGPIAEFGGRIHAWYIPGAMASAASSVLGRPMTGKSENIRRMSLEEVRAEALAWATPENLAKLDAMTDEDIARQIADNPDATPELTDDWFENARLVIPLKNRRAA